MTNQTTHGSGTIRFDREELLRALRESPEVYLTLQEIVLEISYRRWEESQYQQRLITQGEMEQPIDEGARLARAVSAFLHAEDRKAEGAKSALQRERDAQAREAMMA